MRYVEGQASVLADAQSQCPNYEPVEIPLVQGTDVSHMAIDVLLEDCFEALLRGRQQWSRDALLVRLPCPMKQLTTQGTIDRSPRPSALYMACRSNIKVSTPHWAIYGLSFRQ